MGFHSIFNGNITYDTYLAFNKEGKKSKSKFYTLWLTYI